MIIRGVAGVFIGIAYGLFVGIVLFLLLRPDLVQNDSGLIIIDPVTMAWFAVEATAVVAGVCAVLVGLIVSIARLGKTKAAVAGFTAGVLPLGLVLIASGGAAFPTSAHDWIGFLGTIAIFPVGVALTGVVVAVVIDLLKCVKVPGV